jgi:hypothetical protein
MRCDCDLAALIDRYGPELLVCLAAGLFPVAGDTGQL